MGPGRPSVPVNHSTGLDYAHGSMGMGPGAGGGAASGNLFDTSEGDGIWDTAKKWAKVAGEKASEAEREVWRRINNG